ncbi:MAG TPA: NAD(P)/FAD-dependent oxidoreductase, partial [Candidatus Krumholzibacteria bacterium]|nr:NAD(P)/FAD-dependent oxidoreductase [Candidatus Krumholzibacteria bacterium]
MKRTDTIVIGGGQAGLAMSRSLAGRGIDHVVLERGRVGERWRSERRNSLRLLTPRWQSRLPGWSYRGADPDGFMTMPELIRYLEEYAHSFSAPVVEGVTVRSVKRDETGFRVDTDSGRWQAPTVVIATGYCDQPRVPRMAENLPSRVAQMVPARYQNPEPLPDGGVLIVGASATGVQLASEIARSGRHVT